MSGKIIWQDLTVPNAEEVRSFYEAVVGWKSISEDMGGYSDYHMVPADSTGGQADAVAGVCSAQGTNANIPPQWLVYIDVPDIAASLAKVKEMGGEILDGPRLMGRSQFACIKDPAGAVCALFETKPKE